MPRTTLSSREDARKDLVKLIKKGFLDKGKRLSDSKRAVGMSYERLNDRMKEPKNITMEEYYGMIKGLGLKEEEFMGLIKKAI